MSSSLKEFNLYFGRSENCAVVFSTFALPPPKPKSLQEDKVGSHLFRDPAGSVPSAPLLSPSAQTPGLGGFTHQSRFRAK